MSKKKVASTFQKEPRTFLSSPLRKTFGMKLFLFFIFLIALLYRTVTWNLINLLSSGNVLFLSCDPFYHMRRIVFTTQNFPRYLPFDSYINYPHGLTIGWPPLYDQLISFFALVTGLGSPSMHTIEIVGAVFPAILGALTIFPVYLLAKEIFDERIGLLSAFIFAFMPAHVAISRLGFTDHHVAEVFFFSLIAMLLIFALKSAKHSLERPGERNKCFFFSISAGIVTACIVFTWIGAPLYIALIGMYAITQFVINQYIGKSSYYLILTGSIMFGTAMLIIIPINALTHCIPSYSLFSLIGIFLAFIFFGVASEILFKRRIKWHTYLLFIATIVILIPLALQIIAPALYQQTLAGLRYIGREGMLTTIAEANPLSIAIALDAFTTTFFIALIAFAIFLPLKLIKIKETNHNEIFFIVWTIIIFILTLSQCRFAYMLSINISILTGYAFLKICEISEVYPSPPSQRKAKMKKGDEKRQKKKVSPPKKVKYEQEEKLSKVGTIVWLIILITFFFVPNAFASAGLSKEEPLISVLDWYKPLEWMRNNTPETSYYDTPSQTSEYGVMSWWDYGNWILYVGHRPVVANNFQTGVSEAANFFSAEDEEKANKILNQTKVKYVILDSRMLQTFPAIAELAGEQKSSYFEKEFKERFFHTLYARMYLFDGSSHESAEGVNISALSHYRLIYESNTSALNFTDINSIKELKAVKIFEYVPGVRITGKTKPFANITLSVEIRTNRNRTFSYINHFKSDHEGIFEIGVPYAIEGTSYDTKPIGPYTILCEEIAKTVEVSEKEVLNGRSIVVNLL